jgi:hypothetical protein
LADTARRDGVVRSVRQSQEATMGLAHATDARTYRVGVYDGHRLLGVEQCHDATEADALIERAAMLGYEGRLIDDHSRATAPTVVPNGSHRRQPM